MQLFVLHLSAVHKIEGNPRGLGYLSYLALVTCQHPTCFSSQGPVCQLRNNTRCCTLAEQTCSFTGGKR